MTDLLGEDEGELDADEAVEALSLGLELTPEEEESQPELMAALRARFGLEESSTDADEQPDNPTVDPDASTEVEEEEPVAPTAPAPLPDPFAEIPDDDKRSLIGLRNYFRDNPEKAQEVQRVINGEAPPEPVAIPEWIDQDEPGQVALWNHLQSLEAQVRATSNNQKQIVAAQTQTRSEAQIEAGVHTFRTNHPELSEEDIVILRRYAAGLDIIDGLAKTRPLSEATLKALDMGYWDHPEYRAKAIGERTPTEVKKAKAEDRKGKLNALGGSSGSAARSETKPDLSSDNAAKKAAAEWLRQSGVIPN